MLKHLTLNRKKKIGLSTKKGFTVIEVISVLVIIGILTAYVLFRSTNNNNLQTEADLFKSHLRYAQYIALCQRTESILTPLNGNYTWMINASANSYTFYRVDAAGATVSFSLPGETFGTHTFAQGVTLALVPVGTINFDQWGSPGGNDITITLSQGGESRNIIITRNTGFVQ